MSNQFRNPTSIFPNQSYLLSFLEYPRRNLSKHSSFQMGNQANISELKNYNTELRTFTSYQMAIPSNSHFWKEKPKPETMLKEGHENLYLLQSYLIPTHTYTQSVLVLLDALLLRLPHGDTQPHIVNFIIYFKKNLELQSWNVIGQW